MKLNGGRWKIFIRSYTEVILKLNGGMRKLEKAEKAEKLNRSLDEVNRR